MGEGELDAESAQHAVRHQMGRLHQLSRRPGSLQLEECAPGAAEKCAEIKGRIPRAERARLSFPLAGVLVEGLEIGEGVRRGLAAATRQTGSDPACDERRRPASRR
jgi:hypothetical protein